MIDYNSLFAPMLNSFLSFLPNLVTAIALVFIGLIVSKWAKTAIVRLAVITRLSQLSKNPAIQEFLEHAQITTKVENIIGEIFRWIVLLTFIITASNVVGLGAVGLILTKILSVIPSLLAALVILFLGVILAGFLEKIVKGSLGAKDPSLSRFAGRVVSYTTMTIFILAAMSQLGIASFFIQITYVGFILTLVLALGLGIGLGSKDIFKKVFEDWYKKVSK
jgi:hypothetical protein